MEISLPLCLLHLLKSNALSKHLKNRVEGELVVLNHGVGVKSGAGSHCSVLQCLQLIRTQLSAVSQAFRAI